MNAGVSVLMPSFNQAQFIERAVRSVLEMQHEEVSELIVMDGGSTDDTVQLLQRLQADFGAERLRWQSEPDRGPAHALNKALALARQPLIGWLNSDDLYVHGAVRRAVEYFEAHPEHWMVYGKAEHVDAQDRVLGPYPTRPPSAGLIGFADGCYICQPSVFLRRTALRMLGGFEERQKTAFDLALWLRLFGTHAKRIGFIDTLQARSRLHDACITMTQRARVIAESMALLARYNGAAPLRWVRTYVDEMLAEHPFGVVDLPREHMVAFANEIRTSLSQEDRSELDRWLHSDARLQLAERGVQLELQSDGWLLSTAQLRWRQGAARAVEVIVSHQAPSGNLLLITLMDGDGQQSYRITKHGLFKLCFELPVTTDIAPRLQLRSEGGFVPADHDSGSSDSRTLACRISHLRLIA